MTTSDQAAAVAEPDVAEPDQQTGRKAEVQDNRKAKRQPPYNVILWDDDHHSYEYVIRMMQQLFGFAVEKGFQIAKEVDTSGRAICLTTTREHAELKRDQVHAFGVDRRIKQCKGSMSCTIEPAK